MTGKPDPTMHRESVLRSGAERPIVVGDRLDTDIEGANAVGCPSLLVFSGVTTVRRSAGAPARSCARRTSSGDLGGLLDTHPAPEYDDEVARCGTWTARVGDEALVLAGTDADDADHSASEPARGSAGESGTWDDDALDAVRALCTARWETRRRKRSPRIRPRSGSRRATATSGRPRCSSGWA